MLADLLSESYESDLEETWENERTATLTRPLSKLTMSGLGCMMQ